MDVWPNSFWYVLHFAAHHYDPTKRQGFIDLINSYKNGVLPCASCTKHFNEMITNDPVEPHLNTQNELIAYVNNLHNNVNIRLGKNTISINDANEMFSPPYSLWRKHKLYEKRKYIAIGIGIGIMMTMIAKK